VILRERGVEFDVIRYLDEPLSREVLEGLLDRLSEPPSALVRKDKRFAELGLDEDQYQTREAVVDVLLAHPELMQRPIIVRGERAVIGRPPEKVLELLD
jgi:arsenate reductase